MSFLAIVASDMLQQRLQNHAGGHTITFAALPLPTGDFAAVLLEAAQPADVQSLSAQTDTPVLALVSSPAAGAQAIAAGADDYLLADQLHILLAKRLFAYAQQHTAPTTQDPRYILQRVGDGVLIVDDDGIIRYCNPSAGEMLGVVPGALLGSNFGYPIVSGETAEIDVFRPSSGTPHVLELRAVEIEWQGQVAHLATLRDVTARIQAAQELRLRDRAMRASSSAIFILDVTMTEWTLTYANPAFQDITGYHSGDAIGESYAFLRAIHQDVPTEQDLLDAFAMTNEYTATTVSQHSSGGRYWSELRYSPIYDELGRLSHVVVVQNDVTQTKILEQERLQKEKIAVALRKERELNQIKDRFLTMMAHELHTPLASIMLSYDMLTHYGARASEADRQEFLTNIQQQVARLNHMVNDVLDISRTQNSNLHLEPETIDLVPFCRRLLKSVQKEHKNTHKFNFEVNERTVRAAIDPELMERALVNLLSNAVTYSPQGGTITLALHAQDDTAMIDVRDEGIGIPEADQPRLFDPFHRGENVGNLPGTGLGLTIAQQVVRAHEGKISVRSRVGEGTTFTIELPIAVAL